jgi:pyruvate,water dikinase
MCHGCGRGTGRGMKELCAPVGSLEFRTVNGLIYSRVFPLIGANKPPKKLPPLPLLKLATKLHPEMRSRAKTAQQTIDNPPWAAKLHEWHRPGGLRDTYVNQNMELQRVDMSSIDDTALVAHATKAIDHATQLYEDHLYLHNFDLGPIGLLLFVTNQWGIPTTDIFPLLEGASPSTTAASHELGAIRKLVIESGKQPNNLSDIRNVSAEAASAIDAFLERRGNMIISRYDIDGLTLGESPDVLFTRIMGAPLDNVDDTKRAAAVQQLIAAVRARVPDQHLAEFDKLLSGAREAMDLRDENGPITLEWPFGLVRRALLEVGRRMQQRGLAHKPEHALELTADEVKTALTNPPVADELAGRQLWRNTVDVEDAPRKLGNPEPVPPLDILPQSLAYVAGYVQMVISEAGLDGTQKTKGLNGYGVGAAPYTGIARIATSPEAAVEQLGPGEILVVPCTTPAYNMVVGFAGALVTAEGGPLSHAAVIARELGLPAVIGAPRAMLDIPDGATIEVDPAKGLVSVL